MTANLDHKSKRKMPKDIRTAAMGVILAWEVPGTTLTDLIEDALAAERERCAVCADDYPDVAAAIRGPRP